jgi:hypothetical protein
MSNNPRNWSDDEIRDHFDSNPNLRMSQLARMTAKSIPELKRILMPGRRASASRVASQYKKAYREERGMGGLLFSFDRDGLNIRTMPSDPPYNQTYSNTITLSSSGKMAKRNLAAVWRDHKHYIMALKVPYKVTDFIDKKLKEMGTRGRIKWHTKHYPD